jgi:hypothetical protein
LQQEGTSSKMMMVCGLGGFIFQQNWGKWRKMQIMGAMPLILHLLSDIAIYFTFHFPLRNAILFS